MKRILVGSVILALISISSVSAQENSLPTDVDAFIDETVDFVIETLASAPRGSSLIVEPFVTSGIVSPLGELLSVTISTRVANEGPSRLAILAPPTAGPLQESVEADYAVKGRLFVAELSVLIVLQIVETESNQVVRGSESGFGVSPWVEELLFTMETFGGGFIDPYEPDSLAEAYILSPGETVDNRALSEGDEDWYAFEALGVEEQSLFTVGTSSSIDTYIEVFGPDDPNQFLAENDDAEDANAQVTVILEPGNVIWILVRGYDSLTTGSYSLFSFIEPFAGDPLEPNDTVDEAIGLGINGVPTESMIMPGTDEDWYFFEYQGSDFEENVISIETFGDLDTYIELYSEGLDLLMENDDGGDGRNGRIDMFLAESGPYFLRVRHYDGSDHGEYRISVQLLNATPDEWEPDDVRDDAKSIDTDGRRQLRNFTPGDEEDWVTFTLQATSTVEIRTTGDIDTHIVLYDRLGNMVADDDDSGGDYNARLEQVLQRGTYYVQVAQVPGDSVFGGEYGLMVQAN